MENWKKKYSELEGYIAKNPKIKIDNKLVVIPGDVRPEFNRLFNNVREVFIKDKCQTLLNEASPYSSNYKQVSQEVKQMLGIKNIKLNDDLNWFLEDPLNGLMRLIYSKLFNLIKGKVDKNAFENEAMELILHSFRHFLQLGYKKWVTLSLIKLLTPDKAFGIPLDDIKDVCHEPEWEEKKGFNEEEVPELKELDTLSLMSEFGKSVFMTSKLIVYSTKLNRYVSIGADLKDATWTAKEVSDKREWCQLRRRGVFYKPIDDWPDLMVYIDDEAEDIGLIADFLRFCKPDMIVECMEQPYWYQKGGLDKVRKHHDFFNPRLGSYIVSRLSVPEEAFNNLILETKAVKTPSNQKTSTLGMKEQPLDIHILTVGYDQSRLIPLIDALSSRK